MENTQESNKTKKIHIRLVVVCIMLAILFLGTAMYLQYKINTHAIELAEVQDKHAAYIKAQPDTNKIMQEKLLSLITQLQPKLDPLMAREITTVIIRESKAKNLDPALVTGIIFVESVFDPFAESHKEALGLMQVRYSIWKESPELKGDGVNAKGALFWIDKNIIAGTNILKKYYEESGCDMRATLYRYNTGRPNFPENAWNIEYVNKVLFYTYWIKNQLTEENKCIVETVAEKEPTTKDKEAKNG